MKYIIKTSILLAMISLISSAFFSEINAQNIFDISIDPKHASTVFINSEREIKVGTWDESYILFQIEIEPHSEAKEALLFLEIHKLNIIQQKFTLNDFLYLTIPDLDKILQLNDCTPDHLVSYKIIVPKSLDLELRCKNDLAVYGDYPENYNATLETLKAFKEK